MPAGLQVFDQGGTPVIEITDSISKIVGQFQTTANVAGSVNVAELAGGSRIFIFKQAQVPLGVRSSTSTRTQFSIDGRTISWSAGKDAVRVFYGVY